MDASLPILRAKCFPWRTDRISLTDMDGWLQAIVRAGLVIVYEVSSAPYLQLATWDKHQQVRAKRSKFPAPDAKNIHLQSNDIKCNQMISNVPVIQSNTIQSESNTNPTHEPATITLSDAIKTFNQNIHLITPLEAEKLEAYIEDGFDATVITYAINKAVMSNARNMAYIEGILKRLRSAGIMTMEQVEAAERDFEDKKNKTGKSKESAPIETYKDDTPPMTEEQAAKNRDFLKGLFGSIGKTI